SALRKDVKQRPWCALGLTKTRLRRNWASPSKRCRRGCRQLAGRPRELVGSLRLTSSLPPTQIRISSFYSKSYLDSSGVVTKSTKRSTAPIKVESRSRKLLTELYTRRQPSFGSDQPKRWHTPVFQSSPYGTSGQALIPTACGLTAAQISMKGWPVTKTCSPTVSVMRVSLDPLTRWSARTPTRRPGPG